MLIIVYNLAKFEKIYYIWNMKQLIIILALASLAFGMNPAERTGVSYLPSSNREIAELLDPVISVYDSIRLERKRIEEERIYQEFIQRIEEMEKNGMFYDFEGLND